MPSVGTSIPRKDALDKVTGKARFMDDDSFPGLLSAVTLRLPVAHGTLNRIATDKARKLCGVKGILAPSDIPGRKINPLVLEDQVFDAGTTVRFHGETIDNAVFNAGGKRLRKIPVKPENLGEMSE
jgi:CO/xanthine dehydrogenase Mo-binding subunit